ncbi:unnamed protein product [Rotaria sordida]|uniref:LysM domain-containing protein n=1 Tax=Rotaria sordida TaxID=392033 RepID=A0A818MYF7_9BILA|nr:unnamed protein product [Rotaria sordida]CAF3597359.1 unnamed protein product [Rotaria sordida]
MDKISTEISTSGLVASTTTTIPTERRALSEVMQSTKRSGGNYGSLAKSQLQPTYYICHKVESNDTMQRLALKYSINIQEIKRVNKLWSDAELSLLENVYIPVNSSQLSTLRTLYPTLNIVQNPSPPTNNARRSITNASTDDETTSSLQTSDSSTSIPSTTTTMSSYEDYFSKIDQQIRTSKKHLQSFDTNKTHSKSSLNEISSSSPISNNNNNNNNNNNDSGELTSSSNGRTTIRNNGRHKGIHHLSDNSVFVNITANNSREKHISAALERIRRERDDFDEL